MAANDNAHSSGMSIVIFKLLCSSYFGWVFNQSTENA